MTTAEAGSARRSGATGSVPSPSSSGSTLEATPIPTRIRLSVGMGWRLPRNTVLVCAPSRWATPFKVGHLHHGKPATRDFAVTLFAEALMVGDLGFTPDAVRNGLRGRDVACWCRLDQPCHGDVLLAVANS